MKWLVIQKSGAKYEIEAKKHYVGDKCISFYNENNEAIHYLMTHDVFLVTTQSEMITKLGDSNVG